MHKETSKTLQLMQRKVLVLHLRIHKHATLLALIALENIKNKKFQNTKLLKQTLQLPSWNGSGLIAPAYQNTRSMNTSLYGEE